jgi:hypothetical protein
MFLFHLVLPTFPKIFFKDFLEFEMKPLIESNERDATAIKKAWENIYSQLFDTRSSASSSLYGTPSVQKGSRQKKFAQEFIGKVENKFGKGGTKLIKMTSTQYMKVVKDIYEEMRSGLDKLNSSGLLKEYSPWLDNFQHDNHLCTIEIPGKSIIMIIQV